MYKGSQDFIDEINNHVQKYNLLNDEKTRKIINIIKDIYNENNFLDEDTLKEIRKTTKFLPKCLEVLSDLGWVMPSHINFSCFSEHQESNDDLKEYVNKTITHDLFNNNYKNLKYELSMLVINLRDAKTIKNSHGYTTQAYQIYKIFNYDPTYYNCLIPTLFSIFDFIHYHIINTSKYIKKGIVNHYALKSALSNLKRENKSTKLFSVLYMINIYSVGERIYRSTGSSNYNKNQINRNTAVHGINNPDKYTINDFAKLVLLCKGSSEFLE